jgi:hypothetical protein
MSKRRVRRRKVGDRIEVRIGRDHLGHWFWFEAPAGYRPGDLPPPGTEIHGPFATEAECNESQRLVLFGPQCECIEGGAWNPAWDRLQ